MRHKQAPAARDRGTRGMFVTLVGCAVAVLDCDRVRQAIAPADPAAEMDARITARVNALPLIANPAGSLEPVAPHVRVIVTPSGIDFDNAAALHSWPIAERQRAIHALDGALPAAYPIVRAGLVTVRNGIAAPEQTRGGASGFMLDPLSTALADAMALERRHAEFAQARPDATASVYVHRDAPARLVFQVLYTLGQAGFTDIDFVLRAGVATGVLRYRMPRLGDRHVTRGQVEQPPSARAADERSQRAAAAVSDALAALDRIGFGATPQPAHGAARSMAARLATTGAPAVNDTAGSAPAPRHDGPILPVIHVGPSGYAIGWDAAFLQPGCVTEGPRTIAVPLAAHASDPFALGACLAAARQQPAWRDRAALVPNILITARDVPFAEVVRAIVASKESRPGARDAYAEFDLGL